MKFILPTDGRFAANPSSPYGIYMFDQQAWKLDEMEAVVFFGCTPPPAKYFSFRSYVFSAFHNLHPTLLFASLGDSTNHLVINTTGLTMNDPFGKTTVVTSTADMATDHAVRDAFTAAGLSATTIRPVGRGGSGSSNEPPPPTWHLRSTKALDTAATTVNDIHS